MRILLGVLVLLALIVLIWYFSVPHAPPRPSVIVVKPSNTTPTSSPQTTQPTLGQIQCTSIYVKIGQTEICGDIIDMYKMSNGQIYIYAENVWISGPYTISASNCPVTLQGQRYVYDCPVEIYVNPAQTG